MFHKGRGGGQKSAKKCHVLFEWLLKTNIVWNRCSGNKLHKVFRRSWVWTYIEMVSKPCQDHCWYLIRLLNFRSFVYVMLIRNIIFYYSLRLSKWFRLCPQQVLSIFDAKLDWRTSQKLSLVSRRPFRNISDWPSQWNCGDFNGNILWIR